MTLYKFWQSMNAIGTKVIPGLNLLDSCGRREDSGLAVWRQLTEGLLVAMIWLVLRDENNIRFTIQLLQRRDAWLALLFGVGEDGVEDDGWAHNPGIHQDGKGAWE
jgi:hypothetical protein